MHLRIVFATLLGLITCVTAAVFRLVPANQVTKSGETVTIQCAVNRGQTCIVLWYRPSVQMYVSEDASIIEWVQQKHPGKYSLVGNMTMGEYFLQIKNVSLVDAGSYQCSCGSTNKRMQLKVVQPPLAGYPQCTIEGGMTTLFVGDRISLTCMSKGGVPSSSLKWYHNGIPSDNMAHYGNNMVQVRYVTSAMPSHENSVFVCTEESPALMTKRNCTVGPLNILSPLAIVSSLEKDDFLDEPENYAVMDAEMEDTQGVSFTCRLNPNFTTNAVQNTTWLIDGEVLRSETDDFGVSDNGQTIYLKEDSMAKGDIEVSCQVHVDGRSLGNITRLVEIAGPAVKEYPSNKVNPDKPIVYKTDLETTGMIDIRPLLLLNACVILVMLLLILIAVYAPKVCHCRSPIYQEPKLPKASNSRHADSRITELHFVQSEQCQNGMAHCEGSHFYETPDKDGPAKAVGPHLGNAPPLPPNHIHSSSQEMQATFHVVVHSRNGGPISQTVHNNVTSETSHSSMTPMASVTPINVTNSSNNNSAPACCVYAPVRKKSKGNLYTEDRAHPQAHYQRVAGPPRVAEHLLNVSTTEGGNLHQNPLFDDEDDDDLIKEELHSLLNSPCSTLPSNSKLSPDPMSLSYSRTLPLTPLQRHSDLKDSVSCGDISEDDLDSIYANIASLEDISKQTAI